MHPGGSDTSALRHIDVRNCGDALLIIPFSLSIDAVELVDPDAGVNEDHAAHSVEVALPFELATQVSNLTLLLQGDECIQSQLLRELHDLIQHAQNLGKSGIRHLLHGVFFGAALAPVERLGLVTERVTRAARFAAAGKAYRHGEWVVGVVGRSGHGQADDQ